MAGAGGIKGRVPGETMKPVDNNPGLRTPRSDGDQATRRSEGGSVAAAAGSPASQDPAAVAGGESVSLTRAAADLLSLETQLKALPGVDQARVDSIREAIQNGSFEIDTKRIVDSLLATEVELGG
jgi:negative regulator of flagellin synthesis FlgM